MRFIVVDALFVCCVGVCVAVCFVGGIATAFKCGIRDVSLIITAVLCPPLGIIIIVAAPAYRWRL